MQHDKNMLGKLATASLLLALLFAGGLLVEHLRWQASFNRLVTDQSSRSAAVLSEKYAPKLKGCAEIGGLDRNEKAIITALFTLETFAASWLERLLEKHTVRLAQLLDVTPPDWSYGPGQIRLSRATPTRDPMQPSEIAALLLSTCTSIPFAQKLLSDVAPTLTSSQGRLLSQADILAIARAYNGSVGRQTNEGALSSAIYQQLTYDLVMANYYATNAR